MIIISSSLIETGDIDSWAERQGRPGRRTTLDLYGHLYPGDMDRYADQLGDAADQAGTAKIRPVELDGDVDDEGSGL